MNKTSLLLVSIYKNYGEKFSFIVLLQHQKKQKYMKKDERHETRLGKINYKVQLRNPLISIFC
jgi:hypothetical protein